MVLPDHISCAAGHGDVASVEAWLNQGGDVNERDRHQNTMLLICAGTPYLDHPVLLARDKLRNTSRLVPHVREPHHARHGLAVVREALGRVRPERPGNELVPPR